MATSCFFCGSAHWMGWYPVNVGGGTEWTYAKKGTELWAGYNGEMFKCVVGKKQWAELKPMKAMKMMKAMKVMKTMKRGTR